MSNFVNEVDRLLAPYFSAILRSNSNFALPFTEHPYLNLLCGLELNISGGGEAYFQGPELPYTLNVYFSRADKRTLVYQRDLDLRTNDIFVGGNTKQLHVGGWIYELMDAAEPLMAQAAHTAMDNALAKERERQERFAALKGS